MTWVGDVFELLIPIVGIVASFTFVGLVIWLGQRRKEREAYYRHELVKQLADKGGGEAQLLAFVREEAKLRQLNRRQGLVVGGLVTLAVGLGHMFAFRFVAEDIWTLGAIPALIGLALLGCGLFLRTPSPDAD